MPIATGCGIQALMEHVFLPKKIKIKGGTPHSTTPGRQGPLVGSYCHVNRVGPANWTMVEPRRHVIMVGPVGKDPLCGTMTPHQRCGTNRCHHGATSCLWNPLVGPCPSSWLWDPTTRPWRHVTRVGPASGTVAPESTSWHTKLGPRHHVMNMGPTSGTIDPPPQGGDTGQTIYDDLVFMISDIVVIFVTILRAKAPSLINHDEATNFVIEWPSSVTKIVSVISDSSLINTFLVSFAVYMFQSSKFRIQCGHPLYICILLCICLNLTNFGFKFENKLKWGFFYSGYT